MALTKGGNQKTNNILIKCLVETSVIKNNKTRLGVRVIRIEEFRWYGQGMPLSAV